VHARVIESQERGDTDPKRILWSGNDTPSWIRKVASRGNSLKDRKKIRRNTPLAMIGRNLVHSGARSNKRAFNKNPRCYHRGRTRNGVQTKKKDPSKKRLTRRPRAWLLLLPIKALAGIKSSGSRRKGKKVYIGCKGGKSRLNHEKVQTDLVLVKATAAWGRPKAR